MSILAIVGAFAIFVNQYFYTIYFLNLLYFVRDQEESLGEDEDKAYEKQMAQVAVQPIQGTMQTNQTNNSINNASNNNLLLSSSRNQLEGGEDKYERGNDDFEGGE